MRKEFPRTSQESQSACRKNDHHASNGDIITKPVDVDLKRLLQTSLLAGNKTFGQLSAEARREIAKAIAKQERLKRKGILISQNYVNRHPGSSAANHRNTLRDIHDHHQDILEMTTSTQQEMELIQPQGQGRLLPEPHREAPTAQEPLLNKQSFVLEPNSTSMADPENDSDLVAAALQGDATACAQINSNETTRWLHAVLIKRGASATEAADFNRRFISGLLWSQRGQTASAGKNTMAKASFALSSREQPSIDSSISNVTKSLKVSYPNTTGESGPTDEFDMLAGEDSSEPEEDHLVDLLRDSLLHAFSQCDPLHLVLMRLVVIHGVRQDLVGALFDWSQSKVSRAISSVMQTIKEETMAEIKRADPWLELEWEDFLSLCRSSTHFLVGAPNRPRRNARLFYSKNSEKIRITLHSERQSVHKPSSHHEKSLRHPTDSRFQHHFRFPLSICTRGIWPVQRRCNARTSGKISLIGSRKTE